MEEILGKVESLVKRFHTRDPFELASNLNITVKYGEFKELRGFYNCMYRNRFIVINSCLDAREKIITCSHELGHDRLHRKVPNLGLMKDYNLYRSINIYEKEANLFSAHLLISDDEFLDCTNTYNTYSDIASALNVHEELAIIKGGILNRRGFNLKIPYDPKANYLALK
ncbi:ImmA/IrrE family metallo-endopeptidase [Proteinivorax tanatarense]|uniref:ImmA/IrrE family metallo-endopeptidase n=1 Tax=Proteinivorax tanatarense TaxID=1260629 RepID=A0AAU7VHA4_9FIRM